jgi:hypothetical protein
MQRTLIKAYESGFYISDLFTYYLKYDDFKTEHIWVYEFH